MKATVIIGAGYGDEGKGLMTDYICSKSSNPIVIRFNGGAQAGHTVVTPDGDRHVFSHFGSGTFLGAPTYLGPKFIVNPSLWQHEAEDLSIFRKDQALSCHPRCPLTTPYDCLLNHEIEKWRERYQVSRHGSCGKGIHETVVRCDSIFGTYIKDLKNLDSLNTKLDFIRFIWVPERLRQLHQEMSIRINEIINDEGIKAQFQWLCKHFFDRNIIRSPEAEFRLERYEHLVFEGAQGLMLDQDHQFYPYVTHSKTGLTNVIHLLRSARITEVEIIYVTRAYTTRHGPGPFPQVQEDLMYYDNTNTINEWQGSLRFGVLNPHTLNEAIQNDLKQLPSDIKASPVIAVTHLDQVKTHEILGQIKSTCKLPIKYKSYGPTRRDIHQTSEVGLEQSTPAT